MPSAGSSRATSVGCDAPCCSVPRGKLAFALKLLYVTRTTRTAWCDAGMRGHQHAACEVLPAGHRPGRGRLGHDCPTQVHVRAISTTGGCSIVGCWIMQHDHQLPRCPPVDMISSWMCIRKYMRPTTCIATASQQCRSQLAIDCGCNGSNNQLGLRTGSPAPYTAHFPPAAARGPMAFGLRLVRHFFLSFFLSFRASALASLNGLYYAMPQDYIRSLHLDLTNCSQHGQSMPREAARTWLNMLHCTVNLHITHIKHQPAHQHTSVHISMHQHASGDCL
jgi:hypothetical protein